MIVDCASCGEPQRPDKMVEVKKEKVCEKCAMVIKDVRRIMDEVDDVMDFLYE